MREQMRFVTGYCQSHSCRTQVYCRVKRFGKYVSRVANQYSVLQHYNDLLDLYSCFEFAWNRSTTSNRIYFFAKPVMLKLCCELLKLKPTNIPRLKDKLRELEQIRELMLLKETHPWISMHHIKTTGRQEKV